MNAIIISEQEEHYLRTENKILLTSRCLKIRPKRMSVWTSTFLKFDDMKTRHCLAKNGILVQIFQQIVKFLVVGIDGLDNFAPLWIAICVQCTWR